MKKFEITTTASAISLLRIEEKPSAAWLRLSVGTAIHGDYAVVCGRRKKAQRASLNFRRVLLCGVFGDEGCF
ncbi:hypothetical protein C1886_06995 [Pseudomonas sp. FW300-N1A1]|nr:hypothetical protein C1886_06995 [Pseudomonas sp. FW300-N1A1]